MDSELEEVIPEEPAEQEISLEESILSSTKKSLGLEPEITQFDPDIIMCINSVLNILTQLGVGPPQGFTILSKDATWKEFLGEDQRLNMTKSYIFMKVKLMFDPPSIAAVLASYQDLIKEYEWRLNCQVDPIDTFDDEGGDEDV